MWKHKLFPLMAASLLGTLILSGCKGTDIYFSDGLRSSELMKIDGHIVYMDEARLLLAESKHSYESAFNGNIWNEQIFNTTMEEYVKSDIKDKLQKLEYYELMASSMGISLSEEEKAKAGVAADKYIEAAVDDEGQSLGFTRDTVLSLYENIALAEKTFYSSTSSVDVEVSDDEARVIEVQYIFIKTSEVSEDGSVVEYSEADAQESLETIEEIQRLVEADSDFISLAGSYSDDTQYDLELGRGDYDTEFEKAAFELDAGEISDIIQTQYGYYIIKCIEDSIDGMYEDQCSKIILERRKELFNSYYNDIVANSPVEFNSNKWNDLSIEDIPTAKGNFYNIYNEQYDNYFN